MAGVTKAGLCDLWREENGPCWLPEGRNLGMIKLFAAGVGDIRPLC
jgi:hypothetical protein